MEKLYIVATPIGNLKDITLRALEVLKEVDVVLAEDTRVTKKLLSHYGISKPVFRYVPGKSFDPPAGGFKSIALVTDAGTPSVSDPGRDLTADLSKKGFEVIAIPGPSALAAAISVSDVGLSDFLFLGFPPSKKGRKKFFQKVAASEFPVILFESPHRFLKTLLELYQAGGERYLNIARELTKVHEEVYRGKLSDAIREFEERKIRGEFVIILQQDRAKGRQAIFTGESK